MTKLNAKFEYENFMPSHNNTVALSLKWVS